jgi:hypothetical protein
MNDSYLTDLFGLNPRRRDEPLRTGRECKLCSYPAWHFDYVDFFKSCNDYPFGRSGIAVEFFRCQRCELIFTDFCDSWTPADFSAFIYNSDYVKVDPEYIDVRPRRSAEELGPSLVGAESARILDYGSGSGGFAGHMELRGFDRMESYDPFSSPERPTGKFDIITCFDVIEHSPTPRQTLHDVLNYMADDGCVLVGQTLQPYNIKEIKGDWWYIAPRNGHVVTYSSETLHLFAQDHGLIFEDFGDLFALSRPQRSQLSQDIIERRIPRVRRITLSPPGVDAGYFEDWHPAEQAGERSFRWTRTDEVSFGMHPTPYGECRFILPFAMASSPEILAAARLRVGSVERPLFLLEGNLVATFEFPDAVHRHVVLRTPTIQSPAARGQGSDLRPMGIAFWCED